MSGNVRNNKRSVRSLRFTEAPLTVYDTDTWDPLDGFLEEEPIQGSLDINVIETLASSSVRVAFDHGHKGPFLFDHERMEGEEVGDDRIDYTLSLLKASTTLVTQRMISRMVTSEADTILSTELWNFCETTSFVPLHPDQSFDRCRKVGDFEDLGFIDVPPLRILLDVMKGDRSHSSTSVGKATMLGSRMRTPRSEFLSDWYLASFLQDGYLRTSKSTEPKYLPQIMGGSGCRAAFGNPVNLYLSVYAYRGGRCQRIYGSATRELRQSLTSLENKEVIMPILCRRLRDRQEYLHGTYAGKVFIPTKSYMSSFGKKLPEPLITSSGGSNLYTSTENRLLRTRHLVTRTGAEREWEFTTRIRASLLMRGTTVPIENSRQAYDRKRARREFGDALNANTAFAHLLERKGSLEDVIQLTNENFHVVNCGATHFTKWDAEWLFFGGKSENYSIEDLTTSEDLFLRKEVSEDESLRVGSIPLRPLVKNLQQVLTTTSVGMYQIGPGMYEWAADLTDRLVHHRELLRRPLTRDDALQDYQVNPEWVNDDTLIVSRCLRDTANETMRSIAVCLISADKRLGNQISNTCNVQVIRIDPRDYIPWALGRGRNPIEEPDPAVLRESLSDSPEVSRLKIVYLDTGSVNAFLSKIDADKETGTYKVKTPISAGLHPVTRKRTYRYTLRDLPGVPTNLRCFKHAPIQKPKRYRTGPGDLAETRSRKSVSSRPSLNSGKSWRRGE